jgi:hypothetical protein
MYPPCGAVARPASGVKIEKTSISYIAIRGILVILSPRIYETLVTICGDNARIWLEVNFCSVGLG